MTLWEIPKSFTTFGKKLTPPGSGMPEFVDLERGFGTGPDPRVEALRRRVALVPEDDDDLGGVRGEARRFVRMVGPHAPWLVPYGVRLAKEALLGGPVKRAKVTPSSRAVVAVSGVRDLGSMPAVKRLRREAAQATRFRGPSRSRGGGYPDKRRKKKKKRFFKKRHN